MGPSEKPTLTVSREDWFVVSPSALLFLLTTDGNSVSGSADRDAAFAMLGSQILPSMNLAVLMGVRASDKNFSVLPECYPPSISRLRSPL